MTEHLWTFMNIYDVFAFKAEAFIPFRKAHVVSRDRAEDWQLVESAESKQLRGQLPVDKFLLRPLLTAWPWVVDIEQNNNVVDGSFLRGAPQRKDLHLCGWRGSDRRLRNKPVRSKPERRPDRSETDADEETMSWRGEIWWQYRANVFKGGRESYLRFMWADRNR